LRIGTFLISLHPGPEFHFDFGLSGCFSGLRPSRSADGDSTEGGFMLFDYANVLVFIVFSVLFVLALLSISKVFTPRDDSPAKKMSYECGEEPVGSSWLQFNIRFYIVAIAFVIFSVEIAFMFPVATVMRSMVMADMGWFVLAEILIFIGILFLGLVYLWRKGDLSWVKDLQESRSGERIEIRRSSRSTPTGRP